MEVMSQFILQYMHMLKESYHESGGVAGDIIERSEPCQRLGLSPEGSLGLEELCRQK